MVFVEPRQLCDDIASYGNVYPVVNGGSGSKLLRSICLFYVIYVFLPQNEGFPVGATTRVSQTHDIPLSREHIRELDPRFLDIYSNCTVDVAGVSWCIMVYHDFPNT